MSLNSSGKWCSFPKELSLWTIKPWLTLFRKLLYWRTRRSYRHSIISTLTILQSASCFQHFLLSIYNPVSQLNIITLFYSYPLCVLGSLVSIRAAQYLKIKKYFKNGQKILMKNSWKCCVFVKIEFLDKNLTFRIVWNGWTCKKSQETKVVNPAICVKCEKCGQRFIERKTKPYSSKLCKICCSSENRENPENPSFDTNEEVIDVPSEDNDSSDDNLDYLDGNFYMLNTLTHQILKL